jgi:hypothetical protein
MTHEPLRPLLDDPEADPQLRALLAEARGSSSVDDAQLARFTARFAPLVGMNLGSGAVPKGPLAPPDPAGFGVSAKLGGAAIKGATGKVLWSASAMKVTAASLAVGASLWFGQGALQLAPQLPVQTLPSSQPNTSEAAREVPSPGLAPVEPPVAQVAPASVEAREKPRSVERTRTQLKRGPAPDELALIREAQAARQAPAQALRLLAQHRKHFPDGLLSQEREVLAVEALLASGQQARAVAQARAFVRAYPGSVHLVRLRSMVGEALAD